jgi:hypothetical protein
MVKFVSSNPQFQVSCFVCLLLFLYNAHLSRSNRDRRGRDRMVVGFTITYAFSAYHHQCRELETR